MTVESSKSIIGSKVKYNKLILDSPLATFKLIKVKYNKLILDSPLATFKLI